MLGTLKDATPNQQLKGKNMKNTQSNTSKVALVRLLALANLGCGRGEATSRRTALPSSVIYAGGPANAETVVTQ